MLTKKKKKFFNKYIFLNERNRERKKKQERKNENCKTKGTKTYLDITVWSL